MSAQPHPQRSSVETFVIAKLGDGFRVYAPDHPQQIYLVSGTPQSPRCTCSTFHTGSAENEPTCDHIEAVFGQPEPPATPTLAAASHPRTPMVGTMLPTGEAVPVQMTLKRSVSPDGRIDSLSIELSCHVAHASEPDIQSRAERMLALQQVIATGFIQNGNQPRMVHTPVPTNGAIPAQLVSVGGMEGKWGRRLFLVVQAQDKLLKFFGSEKQLVTALGKLASPGSARSRCDDLETPADRRAELPPAECA